MQRDLKTAYKTAWYLSHRIRKAMGMADAIVSPEPLEGTVEADETYVNHTQKEWVRGQVHAGTIDGYWGLLQRGSIGSFHQVSIKHLHRYLSEFMLVVTAA